MYLTNEERKLFEKNDKDLTKLPWISIEYALDGAFSKRAEYEDIPVTFGYIKRLLLEVAKKREIDIPDDIAFDMDELLKKIVKIPESFIGFNALYYKNYEDFNNFIKDIIKGMNSDALYSCLMENNSMNDSFRSFLRTYFDKIRHNLDGLYNEIDEKSDTPEIEEISDEEWAEECKISSSDKWGSSSSDEYGEEWENSSSKNVNKENITDEELISYIQFLNSYSILMEYRDNGLKISSELLTLMEKTKLNEFYGEQEFYEQFKIIMTHDSKKHVYHFHGTQNLESAALIIEEGLGIIRGTLSSTAYEEFSMDDVILYRKGYGGEIGRDAVVIIDQPIEENDRLNIVEPLSEERKINISPSGTQGLDGTAKYIVNPEYIVGYIDKINKKIIFNSRYYDYARFGLTPNPTRPKEVPYSDERIAEGIAAFNPNELEIKNNQLE